jgi:hypothetical protein
MALTCGLDIDPDKFQALADKWKTIYFENVNWYNMSPTVHKVVEHGAQIIRASPVPVGLLSEEGSEVECVHLSIYQLVVKSEVKHLIFLEL